MISSFCESCSSRYAIRLAICIIIDSPLMLTSEPYKPSPDFSCFPAFILVILTYADNIKASANISQFLRQCRRSILNSGFRWRYSADDPIDFQRRMSRFYALLCKLCVSVRNRCFFSDIRNTIHFLHSTSSFPNISSDHFSLFSILMASASTSSGVPVI